VGVHKIDNHYLVLHQVIIEVHPLAILRHQLNVRQMSAPDQLSRWNVLETARWNARVIMGCKQLAS
jgi:hypothetical protein